MFVKCLYSSLKDYLHCSNFYNVIIEISNFNDCEYDYSIDVGNRYLVIGGFIRDSNIFYYIYDDHIRVIPALLFDISEISINDSMIFYFDLNQKGLGVTYASLANIPYWYEKYLDEDKLVMQTTSDIISFNLSA